MSVATTNVVRDRRDLTPAEFAVAYAMASHANPARDQFCEASVETIAKQSGMQERHARKIIRRLEGKGVVFARSTKAGGRSGTVAYEFNINPVPQNPLSTQNPVLGDMETRSCGTVNPVLEDPQGVLERKEREEKALSRVFKYYLDRTGRTPELYSFTIKRKECGRARLDESLRMCGGSLEKAVALMKCAVDAVSASDYRMGRKPGKPETRNEWRDVFGSTDFYEEQLAAANRG